MAKTNGLWQDALERLVIDFFESKVDGYEFKTRLKSFFPEPLAFQEAYATALQCKYELNA